MIISIGYLWENRDLPVLRVIVDEYEANGGYTTVTREVIAEKTGFTLEKVDLSLLTLSNSTDAFFSVVGAGGGIGIAGVYNLTDNAYRAVGEWPTPDDLADRLIERFIQFAETAPEEEASKVRAAVSVLGDIGKATLSAILAGFATGTVG